VATHFHHATAHEMMSGTRVPSAVDPQTSGGIFQIFEALKSEPIEVHYTHIFAGQNVGAHSHPDASHFLIIMSGLAHAWMDGTMVRLEQGDFLEIPRYVLHDFAADPTSDVWDLSVTHPGWAPSNMQYDADPDTLAKIRIAFEEAFGLTEKKPNGHRP
jgi:quercetin dioxygenase-like cupin family protein